MSPSTSRSIGITPLNGRFDTATRRASPIWDIETGLMAPYNPHCSMQDSPSASPPMYEYRRGSNGTIKPLRSAMNKPLRSISATTSRSMAKKAKKSSFSKRFDIYFCCCRRRKTAVKNNLFVKNQRRGFVDHRGNAGNSNFWSYYGADDTSTRI